MNAKQADLSVIILNYKMDGLIKHCLKSIFSHDHEHAIEVIVVDNDSRDNCEAIVAQFPKATFIQAGENGGHAKGNNIGIERARGRYIMILNPDTVFLQPVFGDLIRLMDKHDDVGMATVQLCNPDGSLQAGAWRFPTLGIPVYQRFQAARRLKRAQKAIADYEMHDWDRQQHRDVDWAQGSCLTVRREALNEVGLLDPNLFLYFTDVDWCRRAWELGWKVRYFAGPKLVHYYHRESAESNGLKALLNPVSRIHIKDWLRYLRKYHGKPHPRQT